MRILVAHASRMGSTAEIAAHVAAQLSAAGHDVDVRSCADAPAATGYDAVVLGSALYLGRWLEPALRYLQTQAVPLGQRPTWLFQSGPCGAGFDLDAVRVPRRVRTLARRVGSAPTTTFGGRLDRARTTSRLGRWMATGALSGDFRDWDLISAWTETIVVRLAEGHQRAPVAAP